MRDDLKALELDSETIDKIMKIVGKKEAYYAELKQENEGYKNEIETYKSKIEKLNGKLDEDKKTLENLQTLTNENNDLKAQIQMSGANCKKEFLKFVTNEVKGMVDEKTDFNQALENYKKDNPQYFGDVVVKKVQTSPELTGGNTQPQTTNSIMNDILRGSRNN